MSIKKPTDLPVLPANADRWTASAGKPTANILDADVFQVSISGDPGAAFPGGTIYPTGRSSVQVRFSQLVTQIAANLNIAQITQAIDDLIANSSGGEQDLNDIRSQITGLAADISTVDSRVDGQIASVGELSATLNFLQTAYENADLVLESEISALQSNFEFEASAQQSNISDLQAADAIFESELSALQAADAIFESELSALQAADIVLSADLYELQACAVVSSAMVSEYDAVGVSGAQASAEAWNAQVGDGYESSALAFSTGEFLKIQFGDPKITRYIPLYIFSSDYTSG